MSKSTELYTSRAQEHTQKQIDYKKQADRIAWLRLGVFLGGAGLGWLLLSFSYLLGGIAIIIAVGLFLLLVRKHAEIDQKADFHGRMARVNEAENLLKEGKPGPYDNGALFVDQQHPYTYDLDIFGPRSIFAFINRTASQPGRNRLASWLSVGLRKKEEILSRQGAVSDLSSRLEFRQAAQAIGSGSQQEEEDLSSLTTWLEASEDAHGKAAPSFLRWLLPAQFVLVLVATIIFQLDWYWILGSFLLNLLIVRQFLARTQQLHAAIDKRSKILKRYAELLALVENEQFESPKMRELQAELGTTGKSSRTASEHIQRLSDISASFDQRLNIVAALFFNGWWGWDLHLSHRISIWKNEVKDLVPNWLEVLSNLDALISLGTLAYNHPGFCWPEPHEAHMLEGKSMGHLLISQSDRIDNDLALQGQGQYGLVTGANMAGKSTFLRTVGVNLALAQAGAPVCATSFIWKPATIFTSMRATDSVQDQASYFYAELVRLKRIADLLKEGENSYILLDEILRGTNSKDKAEGSRGFIEQLVQWPGMGLVATHDLSLADLEAIYPEKIRNLRFEIEIDGDQLHCSYKLQPGVSQNLNATFLMKKMGIVK